MLPFVIISIFHHIYLPTHLLTNAARYCTMTTLKSLSLDYSIIYKNAPEDETYFHRHRHRYQGM
jgi:hypothetical protein